MIENRINIDFNILDTDNLNVLSIVDTSNWDVIENEPAIIEITPPGSRKHITHYFEKNAINNFNSINLELSCLDKCNPQTLIPLVDGIYKIVIKGSPSTYYNEKYFVRLNNIKLKLDKAFVKASTKCGDNNCFDELIKIDMLIKSIEASVRLNNIITAKSLYERVDKLINKCNFCK